MLLFLFLEKTPSILCVQRRNGIYNFQERSDTFKKREDNFVEYIEFRIGVGAKYRHII